MICGRNQVWWVWVWLWLWDYWISWICGFWLLESHEWQTWNWIFYRNFGTIHQKEITQTNCCV